MYICLLETENCDEEKYCNKNHRFFAFRNERYNFDFRLWQKNDIADDFRENSTATVSRASRDSCVIQNFDIIYQEPELPTGCEVTALTMAMNYSGCNVDKYTMATEYLPCTPYDIEYGEDGNLYGSSPEQYFIGDPTSVYGYVCGTTPIVTAANNYFKYTCSKLKAIDITGSTPQELYELVDKGYPIVVWVTIGMVERSDIESWTGTDGKQYDWCMDDHAADLIGYSADTVTIADPINGLVEYPKENFESVFTSRNNKCVVLKNG